MVSATLARFRKPEMSQVKRFTLAHGVALSLLLHICLALPFVVLMNYTPRKHYHSPKRLNVELYGMLSNRQVQAQQKRVEGSARPGATAPSQQDPQKNKTETVRKETAPTQAYTERSEALGDTSDAVRLPEKPADLTGFSRSSGGGPVSRSGGDFQQRQQFMGRPSTEADVLNAYLTQLTKRLRANLVYPQEAKRKRLEGVSLISFVVTESGGIKPGTLAVKKSSGYALLDSSALKTAGLSAPFPKPPRELGVSIAVAFEMDR